MLKRLGEFLWSGGFATRARDSIAPRMHLRSPSYDHGRVSALWAIFFGLFILFGSISVGLDKATAFIVSPLAAAAIYFFVRLRGEEQLRR
jgi:hypothetical protein